MISSELPEVLGVSDRILVMREGALVAEFSHAAASEEAVMSAAMGQHDPVSEAGRTTKATKRRARRAERSVAVRAAILPSRQQQPDRSRQSGLAERVFRIRESGILVVLVRLRRGHHGRAAPLPRRVEHPVRAGRHRHLRAARPRRDDGGDQQERGPVGRLRASACPPTCRRACSPTTRACRSPSSSWPASASAWPAASPTGSWSPPGGCRAWW